MISKLRFARTHWGPLGMWAWVIWWFGHNYAHRGLLFRVVYYALDIAVTRALIGAKIPPQVSIGDRTGFVHDAMGVVLNPGVSIGSDCTIYHQVTLGTRSGNPGAPKVGNGVLIGAGAKVLGPVVIGDYASIGANSVVIHDVPAGATAIGVPARIIPAKPGWAKTPRR